MKNGVKDTLIFTIPGKETGVSFLPISSIRKSSESLFIPPIP
jgi:hypothetical protein